MTLIPDMPDTTYHADRGSLSSTGARKILKCPAQFRYELDNPRPSTAALTFGTVAHALVLGVGADIEPLDPEIHGRTKDGTIAANPTATTAWKQAVAQAEADNKIPMHIDEYRKAVAMADAILDHPYAKTIFAEGIPEQSGYWIDPITEVKCRFRPDWITTHNGRTVIVDYKTTASADPKDFAASVAKYGYHQQQDWYTTGAANNDMPDAAFLFICQEKVAPYLVSIIELHEDAVALGARLNRRALDLYRQCMDTDTWPAYGDGIVTIDLPKWAYWEEESDNEPEIVIA